MDSQQHAPVKTYRGTQSGAQGPLVIEVWVDGELVGPLRHHVKHSPTGMSVGYGGSGPADCARSLLIDALPDPWCATCGGEGTEALAAFTSEGETEYLYADEFEGLLRDDVTVAPSNCRGICRTCLGEQTSFPAALYQAFKRAAIARLPIKGTWTLAAADICAWAIEERRQLAQRAAS